jgi:hypothetical protein
MSGVPCVGDSLRDLQAADAVGAQPMLVLTGKGEKTLREGNFPKNTVIFPDLAFAASALLAGDDVHAGGDSDSRRSALASCVPGARHALLTPRRCCSCSDPARADVPDRGELVLANLQGARWIWWIRYRAIGTGNIPAGMPHVVMSKHSSTWRRSR